MAAERGVVIIGTGLISRFHEEAVAQIPGLRVVAKCRRTDDWDAALAQPGVGLCLVANASGAHDAAVFAAARHGVPVLVEKPIAITTARVDAMIAACEAARVPLGCIFQTRWSDEFARLRKAVDSGELGRLTYAAVQVPWWRDDEYYTKARGAHAARRGGEGVRGRARASDRGGGHRERGDPLRGRRAGRRLCDHGILSRSSEAHRADGHEGHHCD